MKTHAPYVFPPALVPVLRDRAGSQHRWLADVPDELLDRLLCVVFLAGLETHEGERNPVRVVFVGPSTGNLLLPEIDGFKAIRQYRWRARSFEASRPFSVAELVKLSVVTVDERMFVRVSQIDDDLVISGIAHEGTHLDPDPYLKIVASRAGFVSVCCGRERILEYERGSVLPRSGDAMCFARPVRRALDAMALDIGITGDARLEYANVVRALVCAMNDRGHGGILVISPDEPPALPETTPYRLVPDGSLDVPLRLARLLEHSEAKSLADDERYRILLRTSFVAEVERTIEEYGQLSAIDGAMVLDKHLGLIAFGTVLPTGGEGPVWEALDSEAERRRPLDLGSRGTRHRAAATWASRHPGTLVFVASQDGQSTCLWRNSQEDGVLAWRLNPADLQQG